MGSEAKTKSTSIDQRVGTSAEGEGAFSGAIGANSSGNVIIGGGDAVAFAAIDAITKQASSNTDLAGIAIQQQGQLATASIDRFEQLKQTELTGGLSQLAQYAGIGAVVFMVIVLFVLKKR